MAKSAVEAPRFNGFFVTTDQLTLITDPDHDLYDVRVTYPVKPGLVASIRAKGIIEPLVVLKDGAALVVLDGRQRFKAAVEANKLNAAEGAPLVKVPIILRKEKSFADAYSTHVVANAHRTEDPVSVSASKALHLRNLGHDLDEIAAQFGESKGRIGRWLHIAEMAPAVKLAIDLGSITEAEAVKELAGLTHAAQRDALATVTASSPAARRAAKGPGKAKARKASPISRLRHLYRNVSHEAISKREAALLAWVFGDATTGELVEIIPRLADVVKGAK